MLHHASSGPAHGPMLLMIHPMGADLTFWDACRADLDASFRSIAVDLRGAGHSPAAHDPITIEEHADDLAAFCEQHGLKRVFAVGCAVGAMIAVAFAGRHFELCDGLVLCNPGFRTLPEARRSLAQRAVEVRAGGMSAVVPAVIDAVFADCPLDARRRDFSDRFARQDPLQYALQIEGMLDADTSPYLEAIKVPTLLVAGGKDGLLPPEHAHRLSERLAAVELVLVPDGAHFIPYQRPSEFAQLVSSFVFRGGRRP